MFAWSYIHNSTVLYWTFALIQHVTSCDRVTYECQMRAHPECSGGCALVCDPVTNSHMLYLDSHPIQQWSVYSITVFMLINII